jgi:hypothetical protein
VNLLVERPWGNARVAGGLLGVAGGEAWRGARGGFEIGGPVTAALLDLGRSYISSGSGLGDPPIEVAYRHRGVPASGWLLPVAIARGGPGLVDETHMLATAAGATADVLGASVAYVTLAAELYAGRPVEAAIEAATHKPAKVAIAAATCELIDGQPAGPRLCGIGAIDAVAAGVWALTQPGSQLATLSPSLSHWCEPWIAAAAAGLLGIRDGCASVPAQWHRRVPLAQDCLDLAPELRSEPTAWSVEEPASGSAPIARSTEPHDNGFLASSIPLPTP